MWERADSYPRAAMEILLFDKCRSIMNKRCAETRILGQADALVIQGVGRKSDRKSEGL
jgi:hypothetical protein